MDRIEFTLPGMLPRMEEPPAPESNAALSGALHGRLQAQPLAPRGWQDVLRLNRPSPFSRREVVSSVVPQRPRIAMAADGRREASAPAQRMIRLMEDLQQQRLSIAARSLAQGRW
jgi:hypothetical protein